MTRGSPRLLGPSQFVNHESPRLRFAGARPVPHRRGRRRPPQLRRRPSHAQQTDRAPGGRGGELRLVRQLGSAPSIPPDPTARSCGWPSGADFRRLCGAGLDKVGVGRRAQARARSHSANFGSPRIICPSWRSDTCPLRMHSSKSLYSTSRSLLAMHYNPRASNPQR